MVRHADLDLGNSLDVVVEVIVLKLDMLYSRIIKDSFHEIRRHGYDGADYGHKDYRAHRDRKVEL